MILKDSKIKEHKLLGKPGLWDSYYMQICRHVYTYMGFPGSSAGKESACNAETWVRSLGWKDPLEEDRQPTLVFLPGELPWTEDPGGLQSMGSQRAGHD